MKIEIKDNEIKINNLVESRIKIIDVRLSGPDEAEVLIRYWDDYGEHYFSDETDLDISIIHNNMSLIFNKKSTDIVIQGYRLFMYEVNYTYNTSTYPLIEGKMYA